MDKTPKTPSKPAKPSPATQVKDKAQARKKVDYDKIEAGWRAGILNPRQLAAIHKDETGETISHAAIIKHFTLRGIPRDLSAKIHAKADAMVTQAMVTGEVTTISKVTEKRIVDEGATMVTEVRLSHRKDISRSRRITNALLDELEKQTDPATLALLEDLGEMLRREDDKGIDKLNDLYRKMIGLSERSKTMKVLADSLRVLVDMERTAYGMDINEKPPEANPVESLLLKIATASTSAFKPSSSDPERFQNPEINGFMPKSLK